MTPFKSPSIWLKIRLDLILHTFGQASHLPAFIAQSIALCLQRIQKADLEICTQTHLFASFSGVWHIHIDKDEAGVVCHNDPAARYGGLVRLSLAGFPLEMTGART